MGVGVAVGSGVDVTAGITLGAGDTSGVGEGTDDGVGVAVDSSVGVGVTVGVNVVVGPGEGVGLGLGADDGFGTGVGVASGVNPYPGVGFALSTNAPPAGWRSMECPSATFFNHDEFTVVSLPYESSSITFPLSSVKIRRSPSLPNPFPSSSLARGSAACGFVVGWAEPRAGCGHLQLQHL